MTRLNRPPGAVKIHEVLKCPVCGTMINLGTFRASQPYQCACCSRHLEVSFPFRRLTLAGSLFACLLVGFVLGLRGWWLAITAVAWPPVAVLSLVAMHRLLPPRVSVSS